jgi:hypothetical protein
MDRDELRALIRTEPTKRATLAEVEPECVAAESHAASLRAKCDSLAADLEEIEDAKVKLASMSPETGEPEPDGPAADTLESEKD